jgi:transporter family-2 protein
MKSYLYLATMFLGVILTVHLAMNGKVGAAINNPRVGNAVFWCIGALGAVLIGLTGWQSGALAGLSRVHPVLLTAGLMGASLVFGIAWLIPQIGAGPMTFALLAGQIGAVALRVARLARAADLCRQRARRPGDARRRFPGYAQLSGWRIRIAGGARSWSISGIGYLTHRQRPGSTNR